MLRAHTDVTSTYGPVSSRACLRFRLVLCLLNVCVPVRLCVCARSCEVVAVYGSKNVCVYRL